MLAMSKLSLRKSHDKTSKITGFLVQKDPTQPVAVGSEFKERTRSNSGDRALVNITNTAREPIVKSPVIRRKVNNMKSGSEKTPEKKRKRNDDFEDTDSTDANVISSPIFKKKRKSAVNITKEENETSTSTRAQNEQISHDIDEQDIFACLDDSDFETSPVKIKEGNGKIYLEDIKQTLASKFGRHKVFNIVQESKEIVLYLQEDKSNNLQEKVVKLKGSWLSTIVNVGDIVNVDIDWQDGNVGVIDDSNGLLVVSPDTLVSGTAVVSALFCMRKALLSEKFKGQEGGNRVMLIGTAVHELLQEVVKLGTYSRPAILSILDKIMSSPRMISDIYALNLIEEDIRKEVMEFIVHIQFFVRRFILGEFIAKPEGQEEDQGNKKKGVQKEQWKGKIVEICDIEENFWSPRLGIKGKIDLTVKTETGKGEERIQPLEIKTGKATHSSSHQGQVLLYCMMSGDRREQAKAGLLLYLRSSDMSQVPAGTHEQRGLIQLRNELVAWIRHPGGEIPEPISHPSCESCGLLDVCAAYQQTQKNIPMSAKHPMKELVPKTLEHLTPEHLEWFSKWTGLLDMEFHETSTRGGGAQLKDLWCVSPEERECRGQAVSGLRLESVTSLEHRFVRTGDSSSGGKHGIVAGELVVVSTDNMLALSTGLVTQADSHSVIVTLDRDMTPHSSDGDLFHLDRFLYQSAQSSCFVGLAKMLNNSTEAARLRESCIDFVQPTFVSGLGREVATHGRAVLKSLNKIQQRAVLKSMMCERYSLIRGMPGTGKTTTIVGLVRMLARMGQSVLIVAYTNSAVDTILCKLKQTDQKFLRLGRKDRVRRELWADTAEVVSQGCRSVSSLASVYSSYNVMASTCLAVNHPATANRKFDWCICDEASQALLPSVVSSLLLAHKFILVGDHAQLPPTVQSEEAKQGGLDQSLFSILDNKHPSATSSLTLQYRMNKQIAAAANHLTYEGKLECGDDETSNRVVGIETCNESYPDWLSRCLGSQMEHSVMFVDTVGMAREDKEVGGIFNRREAGIVRTLVNMFTKHNIRQEDIGVIAPYSAQVKFIKADFQQDFPTVEVGTVDQYQGRDKLVIVYSCTRSNSGDQAGAGHILLDTRRLNVAITRAKAKLIIVGDQTTLIRDYPPFKQLIQFFDDAAIVKWSDRE